MREGWLSTRCRFRARVDCSKRNKYRKTKSHLVRLAMAERKETPKKVYRKTTSNTECICRLCCGIYDPKYTKNLYNKANARLLALAEAVFGDKLPNEDNLPRLLCRPCERKLDNFSKFKKMVCENQTSMTREKRCLNISPSAPITKEKKAKTSVMEKSPASRRSLSFTHDKEVRSVATTQSKV
jgi:hypothetical protein